MILKRGLHAGVDAGCDLGYVSWSEAAPEISGGVVRAVRHECTAKRKARVSSNLVIVLPLEHCLCFRKRLLDGHQVIAISTCVLNEDAVRLKEFVEASAPMKNRIIQEDNRTRGGKRIHQRQHMVHAVVKEHFRSDPAQSSMPSMLMMPSAEKLHTDQ